MNPPRPDPDPAPTTPGTLRAAVRLLAAEAVAVGLVAAFLVYEDVTATATDLRVALFLTAFAAAWATLLAALARALSRRRSGARGPAVVLQLMLLPVGYYLAVGGLAWLGAPVALLGLLVGGLLIAPPTTRALGLN